MANRIFPTATEPTGLRRKDAAAHCGVSETHFDRMVSDGTLPAPRLLGSVKVWLRQELDAALFSIPSTDHKGGGTSCDAAFGLS